MAADDPVAPRRIAALLDVDATALRADLLPRVRELAFTGFLRVM